MAVEARAVELSIASLVVVVHLRARKISERVAGKRPQLNRHPVTESIVMRDKGSVILLVCVFADPFLI